jgi:hypothetical protein
LTNDQFSEFTSILDGTSHNKFIPRSECRYQGVGSVVTQVGTVEVVFLDEIYSMVPPNKLIGWISKRAEIKVEVSHHTGQAGPAAADVSAEAFTSLDDLPCEWTVTAHSTNHYSDQTGEFLVTEDGEVDGTFVAANPTRYDSNTVLYEIVSGSVDWHASGDQDGCPWSRGGTSGVAGGLIVWDDGLGQLTYTGNVYRVSSLRGNTICEHGLITTGPLFWDCYSFHPLVSLDFSDSCNDDHSDQGEVWHRHFEWHLTGSGSCLAPASVTLEATVTPEGTCGRP